MKSTVETPDCVPTFPALYKQKDREIIVLFRLRDFGYVVYSPLVSHQIGDKINVDVLAPCQCELWERLPIGTTVTLTQTT